MDPLPALLRAYRSDDPSAAFAELVSGLAESIPLRCAAYVRAAEPRIRDHWPADSILSADLLDAAVHVMRPEVFPLGSEFPFDASRYAGAEMLLLPLREEAEPPGCCVLIADEGAFGEDLQPWQLLSEGLLDFERRHRRLTVAEERCSELQRRVEESEALHTLGLAVNRTLDEAEVLSLVARFARTLLGAHYVTVNTSGAAGMEMVAAVGLREGGPEADCLLARQVVAAEKPLLVGTPGATPVANLPFHAREGMETGLGIPLSLFGDTFGALVVGYRVQHEITPQDTRLALTLAGHAAVAIGNARLHEKVELRSRELEAAYEELNRVSAAKERFFASINHELRNPIGAILGYHALIMEGTFGAMPEKVGAYLTRANHAAATLRTLVDDLLDLSKIAAGKMKLDLQPCSVADIVAQALNTIQPLADAKGLPLALEGLEGLPVVRTDAKRVQQILVNLLSNAVKFTDAGEVRLRAECRRVAADSTEGAESALEIQLRVGDTGPGIPAEDLERVFEEFEQVPGTRGGTGLGLPISRRLARLLGGDLWAESEPGRGSTFVLRLGSARAKQDEDSPAAFAPA